MERADILQGTVLNKFAHVLDHLPLLQVLILELLFEVTKFFQNSARILRCQHTWIFLLVKNKQIKKANISPLLKKFELMHKNNFSCTRLKTFVKYVIVTASFCVSYSCDQEPAVQNYKEAASHNITL